MNNKNYVTYEVAKLLNDKKIELGSQYVFDETRILFTTEELGSNVNFYNNWPNNSKNYCEAPHIWDLKNWFKEHHKVFIVVDIDILDNYFFELYDLMDKRNAEIFVDEEKVIKNFKTEEEAYNAAFEYVLTNLI